MTSHHLAGLLPAPESYKFLPAPVPESVSHSPHLQPALAPGLACHLPANLLSASAPRLNSSLLAPSQAWLMLMLFLSVTPVSQSHLLEALQMEVWLLQMPFLFAAWCHRVAISPSNFRSWSPALVPQSVAWPTSALVPQSLAWPIHLPDPQLAVQSTPTPGSHLGVPTDIQFELDV